MVKNLPGEQWKTVRFDLAITNDFRLEVSNYGRLRTFNKISNGNLINGSLTEGYRIVRLKLYRQRDEKTAAKLEIHRQSVFKLARKLKAQGAAGESKDIIANTTKQLQALKKSVSKKFQQDLKNRTINYQSLIHRLVANYFLPPPKAGQTLVAHLDYDKLNNRAFNLKWMTPEENYEHQKKSPHVLKDKLLRKERQQANPNRAKLTVTKVMLVKKLLAEGKTARHLAKVFKVSDMQIIRIKRNENWSNVPAAK